MDMLCLYWGKVRRLSHPHTKKNKNKIKQNTVHNEHRKKKQNEGNEKTRKRQEKEMNRKERTRKRKNHPF